MLKIFKWQCVLAGILLSLPANAYSQEDHRIPESTPPNSMAYWSWTKEEWTSDDLPYRRMRFYIDRFIAQGQKAESLAQKYKPLRDKQPADPKALFRWAYASYRAAISGSPIGDRELKQAQQEFSRVGSPNTYQYARLRFLVEARAWPHRELKSVGERLAKRDAKDYSVRYYLVKLLDPGSYPEEKQPALVYTRELVRLDPKRPSAYSSLGSVHFKSWLGTKTKADADKVIAAYRKYLQLAPVNDSFRPQAQNIIKMIQKG